jgi:hypothetical protein
MCDGSHRLSKEEYKQRTEKLAALFKKPVEKKKDE